MSIPGNLNTGAAGGAYATAKTEGTNPEVNVTHEKSPEAHSPGDDHLSDLKAISGNLSKLKAEGQSGELQAFSGVGPSSMRTVASQTPKQTSTGT
jgi:hypothetical protein